MSKFIVCGILFVIIVSCSTVHSDSSLINKTGKTIKERFEVPKGYRRIEQRKGSFGYYLRRLPVKPHGTKVKLYDNTLKDNQSVSVGVIDLPIGKKDLHQCADAVMRLRAEYLWKEKKYSKIHFNFTNGFRVDYTKWMKGNRIAIKGNKTWWVKKRKPANSYKTFWQYMEQIFMYAGTYSLAKELKNVNMAMVKPGDVFIQGGMPGHAVIVLDVAEHIKTKKRIILLAQSYMPAQETHVLDNYFGKNSPWYSLDFGDALGTPEWTFSRKDLKRFRE